MRSFAYSPVSQPVGTTVIESIDLSEMLPAPEPKTQLKKALLDDHQQRFESFLREQQLLAAPKPRITPELSGIGRNVLKKPRSVVPSRAQVATSPPPKILAIDANELDVDRLLTKRQMIPAIDRYSITGGPQMPSIVSSSPSRGHRPSQRLDLGMRMAMPPRQITEFAAPNSKLTLPAVDTQQNPIAELADTHVIDSALRAELQIYREPDGGGVFRLQIEVNERGDHLPALPKDVLILQDASASIKFQKLKQFKRGLQLALDTLNPQDTFNIVAFRDHPKPLFDRFVRPIPENLQRAREFVGELHANGKTDVYAGLAPYVSWPRDDPSRPYLVFLISDGRTTTKKMQNDQLIRRVIENNTANVSIFSFSAGENTNLELMEFLSYKNRGGSRHEARLERAHLAMSSYLGSLSEILVADLRCRITGVREEDVFPRQLMHLFRGHPLTVWGRFSPTATEIGVQIVGRSQRGKREELVMRHRVNDAKQVGPELARQWAAQKIYHLLAERTINGQHTVTAELERLSEQYDIQLPY